jgi:hypothetical protein
VKTWTPTKRNKSKLHEMDVTFFLEVLRQKQELIELEIKLNYKKYYSGLTMLRMDRTEKAEVYLNWSSINMDPLLGI